MNAVSLTLPWPPTVNTYWRSIVLGGKHCRARSQVLISEQGRTYRKTVAELVLDCKVPRNALKGSLAVKAIAFPPDRRARDLDNLWKGMLDSLKHAGVIRDDGDIDDLHIVRGGVKSGGYVLLTITEIGNAQEELYAAQA